jgi:hypothetical protein
MVSEISLQIEVTGSGTAAAQGDLRHDVDALCEGLADASPRVKYGSAKGLLQLSEEAPAALYPRFDLFARLLDGENTILRWNATRILGNLAPADREGKIENMFDHFFAPILGKEMIGAANTMQAGATIALAKPHLAGRIAAEILKVGRARYATPECRNFAMGHAIQALDRFFHIVPEKKRVLAFVRRQLANIRPATRRKAEKFLKKWQQENAGRLH